MHLSDSVMHPLSTEHIAYNYTLFYPRMPLLYLTARSRSRNSLTLSVAKGAIQVVFSAAVASGLVELIFGTLRRP